MKKLFLAHHSAYSDEVAFLADELRLRGVTPWVDEQGGLKLGVRTEEAARRAICRDSWGFLLYASPTVFGRPFIRQVEVPTALDCEEKATHYRFMIVQRGIKLENLRDQGLDTWHQDLTRFRVECAQLADIDNGPLHGEQLSDALARAARECAASHLSVLAETGELCISMGTYCPPSGPTAPCIDASRLLGGDQLPQQEQWARVAHGFRDFRSLTSHNSAVTVRGNWSLPAGLLFGFQYRTNGSPIMNIVQEHQVWSSQGSVTSPPRILDHGEDVASDTLLVELSISHDIRRLARKTLHEAGIRPRAVLTIEPEAGPGNASVANAAEARGIAAAFGREVRRCAAQYQINHLHLFCACPQALAMLLGRQFNALPPATIYQFDKSTRGYIAAFCLSH